MCIRDRALDGHDLLAGAQTGTGKTAAFGLPLLQHLGTSPQAVNGVRKPRALILAPTRELAVQVHDSLRDYSKYLRIPSTTIYGGAGMGPQQDALRRGVDPVSYTHLDVYKRQARRASARPADKRIAGRRCRLTCLLYTSRCV